MNTCKCQIQVPGRSKTVDSKNKEDVHTALFVRGIICKEEELVEVLRQRHIKISVFNETKNNYGELKIQEAAV